MSFKKPTASDWQDFSLKKDIENLNRLVERACDIGSTIIIEVVLAFGAVLFDRFFDIENAKIRSGVWIAFAIAIVALPIIKYGIPALRNSLRTRSVSVDFKQETEYIDSFDNEICYYVMIADSFLDLLKHDTAADTIRKTFYFAETRFYLNKAIDKLSKMMFKLGRVFDDDIDIVTKNKKVSIARLNNILDIIVHIETEIVVSQSTLGLTDDEENKLGAASIYTKKLDDFLTKASTDLNIDVNRFRV